MRKTQDSTLNLGRLYSKGRFGVLKSTATALQAHVADFYLKDQPRIDRISARPKEIKSFLEKARKKIKSRAKYSDPLSQIQDQLGVRIITFFQSDVDRLDGIIRRYFRPIEFRDHVPETEWEFGYFGRHYVFVLPRM